MVWEGLVMAQEGLVLLAGRCRWQLHKQDMNGGECVYVFSLMSGCGGRGAMRSGDREEGLCHQRHVDVWSVRGRHEGLQGLEPQRRRSREQRV